MLNPLLQVKDQDPAETAILNSALTLFLLSGEDRVSVTHLVQTAGISRSVFYHHFSGKDDLLAALLLADELGIGPILNRARRDNALPDLMRETLSYRMQHLEKQRLLMRIEERLQAAGSQLERFLQWQRLRHNHLAQFAEIARTWQGGQGDVRDDDPLYYHYGLVWALANGLATLSGNDFYHELIQDRRGFARFLADAVTRLGEV